MDAADAQLLRQYADEGSEAAFAELYRRHAPWVAAVARRQVGDHELARDVTQAVFLLLAQRAGKLKPDTVLPAWLFQTVRLTCKAALRVEARRKRREREVAMMKHSADTAPGVWSQLVPFLDELVGQLRVSDRDAVLLRFYQRKSHQEVGMALGLSADAARKRIERALRQLQGLFARRGVVLSAAGIGAAMWESSSAAGASGAVADLLTQFAIKTAGRAAQIASSVKTSILVTKIAATILGVAMVGAGVGAGAKLFAQSKIPAPARAPAQVVSAIPATKPASVTAQPSATISQPIQLAMANEVQPKTANPAPAPAPANDPDLIRVRGIVLDPDGKPVAAAQVSAPNPLDGGMLAKTTSAADGRFEMSWKKSQASAWAKGDMPAEHFWQEVKVAAFAGGYGLAWAGFDHTDANGDLVLKLVPDAAPIEARILDAQGNPAASAKVRIFQVQNPDQTWRPATPGASHDARGFSIYDPAAIMGLPDPILTDSMGRVTIKGLGSERRVYLGVKGTTIAASQIEVITRYM